MSHQTGIRANEVLKKFLSKCRDGKVRVAKISIENEQLVLANNKDVKSTWEKDFDLCVTPLIEEDQPCYILYRYGSVSNVKTHEECYQSLKVNLTAQLIWTIWEEVEVYGLDSKNESGYDWLFISWSPDTAAVRQKMLYASTKATLKQEFGTSQIKEELHGTIPGDVTLNGYRKYKKAAIAPAPLTTREEELQELKRSEVKTDYSVNSKQQTLTGVAFPITETAKQAITDMARGSYDYLQFEIDIEAEKIHLVTAENLSIEKLPSKIPEDGARYHLYKFKHTHEGDYMENIVFIYSMPGYNCSIKERMLYSSCKNPLTDTINNLGLEIVKKLEIDSGSELNEAFLYEEIHPTKNLHRPKFAKPKGPPNRGPKRITKSQNSDN